MSTYSISAGELKLMGQNLGTLPKVGDHIWIHVCSHFGQVHAAVVQYVGNSYFESYIEHFTRPGGLELFSSCISQRCGCGWYHNRANHLWYDPSRAQNYLAMAGRVAPTPEPPSSNRPPWLNAKPPPPPGYSAIKLDGRTIEVASRKIGPVTCTGKHCPDPCNPYAEPNQPDGSFKCYSCRGGMLI